VRHAQMINLFGDKKGKNVPYVFYQHQFSII
jgi:hypothetical protein